MTKKIVVSLVAVGVVAVAAVVVFNKKGAVPEVKVEVTNQNGAVENAVPAVVEVSGAPEVKEVVVENENKVVENATSPAAENVKTETAEEQAVKEFSMTSFVEMVDGKPMPQYSLKEMKVKKGDKVRVKITMTKGMHDFKIDEFGVYTETPLNQETTVEFIADKAGEFVYYCTKPGHRQAGHWGTLTVTE